MDKRFFLALLLSLVVIALSQLVFPPSKTPPASRALQIDSSAQSQAAASSTLPNTNLPAAPLVTHVTPVVTATTGQILAETTTVTTAKAIYRFTNIGAAPVSIVMRDYRNRSVSGGLVDLAAQGSPLLGYRLVTPSDTVDLSRVPFTLSRATNTGGEESLTYKASVKNYAVSIAYRISQDTTASYVVGVNGQVNGTSGQPYLLIDL